MLRLLRSMFLACMYACPMRNCFLCTRHDQGRDCSSAETVQVQQLFRRVPCASYAESHDARFEFFTTRVWPRLSEAGMPGLLLVTASYFDFVRLHGFLKEQRASLAVNSEYTDGANVMRARTRFRQGERKVLLYTERAHFYFRPHLKCAVSPCSLHAVCAEATLHDSPIKLVHQL